MHHMLQLNNSFLKSLPMIIPSNLGSFFNLFVKDMMITNNITWYPQDFGTPRCAAMVDPKRPEA